MLFAFKIWDKKWMDIVEEGELIQIPHPNDTDWVKRDFIIDTDQLRITSFQEYDLYADEIKNKKCVQVYFTDEDHVLAAYTLEGWLKLYESKYVPIVTEKKDEPSA